MFLLSSDYYQVKKTAKKGKGVFARKHIPAGTLIGDYLGRIVSDSEGEELEKKCQGCYSFEYIGEDISIFPLDLKKIGVHLINHSCGANCSVYDYQGHNIFFALRHIFPGEELTFDYSFDSEAGGGDSACFCESPFCRGTMYARADKPSFNPKKKDKKKAKKVKEDKFHIAKIGEILLPLDNYPKEIKDNMDIYDIYANLEMKPLVSKEKKLPPLKVMRTEMRLTGRRLKFPELNLTVLAIVDKHLIIER